MIKTVISVLSICAVGLSLNAVTRISARDFGAFPNDGKCDAAAINRAITAAPSGAQIELEAGTYNLLDENNENFNLVVIRNKNNITLSGQTNKKGIPSTLFELNVKELKNDMDTACPLRIFNSNNINIKNIAFDNKPAFATAGKITRVDTINDIVEVEIFKGLPHFDGMSCYSANNWNLSTGELIPGPALTIGADPKRFKHYWKKVEGNNARLYKIQGMKFSAYVKIGEGVSWHFYVRNRGGALFSAYCNDLTLENLHFYNSKGVTIGTQFCKNIVYRNISIMPRAPQLAVGARDAFHLVCNDGTLLVDNIYIKGVRWDPFNIKSKFCVVSEIVDRRTLKCTVITGVSALGDFAGTTAVFWVGKRPVQVEIADAIWEKGHFKDGKNHTTRKFTVKLAEDMPADVKSGSTFTPHVWNFDKAIFKNSTFEANCGRAILYQGENLEISNCIFNNNSYANIALGPINITEGGFVRNAKIVNNKFINSTWINTTPELPHNGTIKIYQYCPEYFHDNAYNDNILIENNLFKGIKYNSGYSAISITNAQNVTVRNNEYIDCLNKVYVDKKSTGEIILK
jgi:hypothetical protein